MRLRKPCQHGRYEEHGGFRPGVAGSSWMCPGGEFLGNDAIVIEREPDGQWPEAIVNDLADLISLKGIRTFLDALGGKSE